MRRLCRAFVKPLADHVHGRDVPKCFGEWVVQKLNHLVEANLTVQGEIGQNLETVRKP